MFRIWFSIAVAAVAFAAVGAAQAERGVRPAEPAGKYMTGVVKQKLANQYDLAWQSLYPAHQRIASLRRLCRVREPHGARGPARRDQGDAHLRRAIRIAGASRKVMTRAIRMRVVVAVPQFPFPIIIDQTFHAIAVAGQWKWILSADQYAYYSEESCPYA